MLQTSGATVSTEGLWHYPASIIDPSIATAFATFGTANGFPESSVAGIINKISGRQQVGSQDSLPSVPCSSFVRWCSSLDLQPIGVHLPRTFSMHGFIGLRGVYVCS